MTPHYLASMKATPEDVAKLMVVDGAKLFVGLPQ